MDESVPYKGSTGGRRAHTHASACESRTAATIVREAHDLTDATPREPKSTQNDSETPLPRYTTPLNRATKWTLRNEPCDPV